MRWSQPKIALYVALIFASGALLGGFAVRLYTVSDVDAKAGAPQGTANFRARFIEEAQRRLNLTEEQLAKLVQILDETRDRMRQVNARMEPEIEAVRAKFEPERVALRNEQTERILGMLTPEQRPEYEKWLRERDERAKAKAAKGGAGPK
jgi:Spy/CpxP family protein refolding chaperone